MGAPACAASRVTATARVDGVSTRVQLSRDYPYGVPAFATALADPEFHRIKLDVDGSGGIDVADFHHRRHADGAEVTVTLRQPVPTSFVPGALEQFLRGRLVLERTERWTLTKQRCDGSTEVAVPGTPISADGVMTVAPAGSGASLGVDLGVAVGVPLLGGGIERAVVTGIRRLTGTEHERISAWLASQAQNGS